MRSTVDVVRVQKTLDITRRFIENRDGTFDLYEAPPPTTRSNSALLESCAGRQPIRPAELRTFLKIGQHFTVAAVAPPRHFFYWRGAGGLSEQIIVDLTCFLSGM